MKKIIGAFAAATVLTGAFLYDSLPRVSDYGDTVDGTEIKFYRVATWNSCEEDKDLHFRDGYSESYHSKRLNGDTLIVRIMPVRKIVRIDLDDNVIEDDIKVSPDRAKQWRAAKSNLVDRCLSSFIKAPNVPYMMQRLIASFTQR